jgi:Holliday junction resolvasome RuvABC endonuclease subunit
MQYAVMGIDPGAKGGICVIEYRHTDTQFTLQKLENLTEADIADFVWQQASKVTLTVIEKLGGLPKHMRGSIGAFKIGKSYGFLLGLLTASNIPFEEVTPQKWQKAMDCLTGGDKNITKSKCQKLFPHLKATHAISDAVLMAAYANRLIKERG